MARLSASRGNSFLGLCHEFCPRQVFGSTKKRQQRALARRLEQKQHVFRIARLATSAAVVGGRAAHLQGEPAQGLPVQPL